MTPELSRQLGRLFSLSAALPSERDALIRAGAPSSVASIHDLPASARKLVTELEARVEQHRKAPTEGQIDKADFGPVVAHLNGQPEGESVRANRTYIRDSEGKFATTPGGGALDKLKLASRIQLGEGETLQGSTVLPSNGDDYSMPAAFISTPNGRELRIGFVANEDIGRWSGANLGGTVRLDGPATANMAQTLDRIHADGVRFSAKLRDQHARQDRGETITDPMEYDDTFAEGVIPGGDWGDIYYAAWGNDTVEGDWALHLVRQPPDAPAGWTPDWGYEGSESVGLAPADVAALSRMLAGDSPVTAKAADDDDLHRYWTKDPEGLAKWVESPEPWTALVRHLSRHVGRERAKRIASRWYIEVFGYAAGSDKARVAHGKPPRGKVVGPG